MAEMTEEHKQKMAEGRRRAAEQRKAEAEAAKAAEAEAARIAAEVEKTNPTPTPLAQEADVTAVAHGGQQEWGPFEDFQEVHTPYGLYGLTSHTIMHFEEVEEMLEGQPILTHKPRYRKVAAV